MPTRASLSHHDDQTAGGLAQRPGFLGATARFWQRTYAPDYVGLLLLLGAFVVLQFREEPFHRLFSLDDPNIQYPHAEIERVPVAWLGAFAAGLPLSCLIVWAIFWRPGVHKAHVTFLGLFISLILTSFLTDVAKNAIGRPRPDLLSRCKPNADAPSHELISISSCTETHHHTLHDGWRSFPSGHSSSAFAGLGFLSVFLCGQLHVLRPRTNLISVLLVLSPLIGAALIAISRLEDYRHDPFDVTVGSVLGMVVAHMSYRRYYPALRSAMCHVPFPKPGESMGKETILLDEGDVYGSLSRRQSGRDDLEAIEESIPLRPVAS